MTALPAGRAASQARYSSRAGPGVRRAQPRSMSSADCSMCPAGLWAATQICSSLTHTAQLPSGVSVACPSPRVRAPTAARPSSAQSSSPASTSCASAPGGPRRAGASCTGPYGTSQRCSRSSATRCPSRSSRAGTGTGPADSWRRDSTCGTASTTSATAAGSASRGAGWARDQASRSATQPRRAAESSLSQARRRQPGRAVSPCSSTRPARRARSHATRTCAGVRSSASAARSRSVAEVGSVTRPRCSAAQWATRTASARTRRA